MPLNDWIDFYYGKETALLVHKKKTDDYGHYSRSAQGVHCFRIKNFVTRNRNSYIVVYMALERMNDSV